MSRPHLLCMLLLGACASPPTTTAVPAPANSSLPEGVVASVDRLLIYTDRVQAVADAQGVSAEAALHAELRDAVFASAAIKGGFENTAAARVALRGVLARARLESLREESAALPITDVELAEATSRHFVELDRPESFRVIHAVVRADEKKASIQDRARAKTVAERIAERVAAATDADGFRERASAVAKDGFEVTIESLLPVAADGRIVDLDHPVSSGSYTSSFARAAATLSQAGQKTGVVATEFGFHVLMLLERLPPLAVAVDERRRILHDEIVEDRAKRAKKDLVARLRAAAEPSIDRAAEAITASLGSKEHDAN